MRKIFLLFITAGTQISAIACPSCKLQQPRLIRGFLHGDGPENGWEVGVLFLALLIFGCTLYYSVKWLIWPREPAAGHIKHLILEDE